MANHKYCTKEQVKLWVVPEADLTVTDIANKIDALIEAASAMVDRFCKRPTAYFAAQGSEAVATTRRIRGEGKNYLRLGRHFGGASITSPIISAASVYANGENGWLYYNDQPSNDEGEYFPSDIGRGFFGLDALYVVSAKWGFETTPPDVAMATALIVGKIWDHGKGVIGEISPSGFVIERDMPPVAKTMLTQWIRREFELN